jgi:hypothetical protein
VTESPPPARTDAPTAFDPARLARAAADALASALAGQHALHVPGARERHRHLLEQAIDLGERALAAHSGDDRSDATTARAALVAAYAARAVDACHGARQLSFGAQRAPTLRDCEDGWERVAEIVTVAEASAQAAVRLASELPGRHPGRVAQAVATAEAAAREARQLLDARNHAYTFHADPGFSFGEGWYLAAAAVLAGVTIQLEPGKPQTAQAARFLHDAGLDERLRPYRPRPRANKHLPELVARAFRADPASAQGRLREAFLGTGPIAPAVVAWTALHLADVPPGPKVLLWVRHGQHHPTRNTQHVELVELAHRALTAGLRPLLVGDALRDGGAPPGAVDLTLFWRDPVFQGPDMRRAQLQLFDHLARTYGLVGQLGVTTAGMDGPALLGLPTLYLTEAPNVRLGTWVGTVPGYQEMVRTQGYLDRIGERLRAWAGG